MVMIRDSYWAHEFCLEHIKIGETRVLSRVGETRAGNKATKNGFSCFEG
jgi:hypothetical protein